MNKISVHHFRFMPAGYGHYEVIYTSPATGKRWRLVTNNMELIDNTRNAEEPKRKDLELLKRTVKSYGREL